MSRAIRQGLVVAALVAASFAGTVSAEAAPKNGPGAYLAAPGCPVDYRVQKSVSYDRDEEFQALHWNLKIHGQLLEMRPPIDWKRDPVGSQAFRARLSDLSWLDQLLYIYVTSEDYARPKKLRALRMSRNIVLSWIHADDRGKINDQAWTDRVVARRATVIAFVARAAACEGALTRAQAKELLTSIRKHARWLRNPAHHKISNHGLSVDLALASLGQYLPQDRTIARGAKLGETRYRKTFFSEFNRTEGVWLEHSMGYYDYAIHLVDQYLAQVNPGDAELRAARAQLVTSLAWLTAPDQHMAMFGDTNFDKPPEGVRAEAATQSGFWVAPQSGYAVVKDPANDAWLAIASAYHSGVHKHSDELSFEIYQTGVRVVQSTGQYDKDAGPHKDFQDSPAAASTLIAEGKQVDSEKYPPYGSGIYAWGEGDGWYAVWATNPVIAEAQGVGHARLFLYKPGYALFVADAVASSMQRSYTRYFQLGPKLDATREDQALKLTGHGFKGYLSSTSTVGTGTLQIAAGQSSPLAGWTYVGFREGKPRTTASWRTVGTNVDHLATFSLGGFDVRGALGSPLSDDTTIVIQNAAGVPQATVHVVRSGTVITLDQVP